MQRAEVLALRGLSVGQEAEVMDAEGDYRAAALYYASAVKVLMAALTAAATASAGDGSCVQRWADEQLHARVSDRSRDYLKRAEKLSRFARISERSELSVRSRRRPKQQQQSSAATVEPPQPPTAILVEIPVFVPTPPPLPPPPPPPPPPQQPQAPLPTTAEGAIGATIVRGLTQAVDALARALEQPGRAERFPRNAPYAVTGDHGETFEFVAHAPWTFSRLRHSARLPERLYLSSFVESSQPLVPLRATGRSGSVFLGTPDGRFIVKTINDEEHACLLGITDDYFVHVTSVAASLLVRFYGHFSLRLIGAGTGSPLDVAVGTVLHVVVMENLFPADKSQILECYDLKGSTYKRVATEKEKQRADRVLKDLDLSTGPRHAFRFSRSRKDLFIDAIENDSLFLERHGIMDYSLLIGVKKKSKDLSPTPPPSSAAASAPGTEEAWPSSPFRCDGGGFASYGGDPAAEVYYVGIIDILQPFNVRKRVEYTLKSVLTGGKEEISATDPQRYGSRFREFLSRVIIEDSSHVSRQPRPDYLHDAPSSP